MSYNFCFALVFGLTLNAALDCFAASPPALSPAAKPHQVVMLWGPPIEKFEQESARREVWIYPEAKVVFSEGSLLSTYYQEQANAPTQKLASVKTNEHVSGLDAVSVEAILTELMSHNEVAAPTPASGYQMPGRAKEPPNDTKFMELR